MNLVTTKPEPRRTTLLRHWLNFIFPPQCSGCQQGISGDSFLLWCDDCREKLCSQPEYCCPTCGAEQTPPRFDDARCRLCRDLNPFFDQAVCLGNYLDLMQPTIVRLKGTYDESTALQLGMLLGEKLAAYPHFLNCDGILPVPFHWWNRWRKPANLPHLIALGVSRVCQVPVWNNALMCMRRTKKQGMLDTRQRFANVKGAFQVRPGKAFQGRKFLIVDDVVTSCATVNELAKILKKAGAQNVLVAAIARGVRHH